MHNSLDDQSLPNNCNIRNLVMAELSTRVSPDGSPADLVARAVNMHMNEEGDRLGEHTAASVGAIKELRASQEARSDRATFQNQAPQAFHSIHTTHPISPTQRHSPKFVAREPSLAHQAALRRLNGISSKGGVSDSTDAGCSSYREPVLVRKYSNPNPEASLSKQGQMKKNRKSKVDPKYDLPPLESFSFQDILASIDPEIKISIDSIAEICGRSKLSLADEYGSHLPPQGEFIPSHEGDDVSNTIPTHLDTLHEASSLYSEPPQSRGHDRRHSASLGLIAAMNQRNTAAPSFSTAATSILHSEPHPEFSSYEPGVPTPPSDAQPSLLPHVIAWLRRSSASFPGINESSPQVDKDIKAKDALHKILTKSRESEPVTRG